ncbi:unnamed protein product [Mucor fragilis]
MSSLVNFFDKMNINESGGNTASRTSAAPAKPQRRFGVSVPKAFSASKYVGSKRKPEPCIICLQNCVSASSMKPDGCDHAVCDTCLCTYYQTALNDARYRSFEHIQCPSPDCEALFVSKKVIRNIFTVEQQNDWWVIATTRTFIENKVECPFEDCKAIFDVDIKLTKTCTFAECYECRRGVCTACQSSWHPGVIKILNDEEELKKTLREAKEKSWTRCPKCQNLIERKDGCLTIWCKCGAEFCYRCGGYSTQHACVNKCHTLPLNQVEALRSQMFASISNLSHSKVRKVR